MEKLKEKNGFRTNATLAMLALGVAALGAGCACHRPPPDGMGMMKDHHPQMPLIMALDANHDGIIDAGEIANAPVALKMLDKNGDGQLTPDELRPAHPPEMHDPDAGMRKPSPPPPG